MERVSIIVPIYNCELYIKKCLTSIINQTYKNIEIIVVNDGSTDNSVSIIKELMVKDKRIKLLNQKNSGVSIARNKGLENSKGNYVLFIDSDDWIEKNCIEDLVNKINEVKTDVIRYNYIIEDKNGSYKQSMFNLSSKKYVGNSIVSEEILSHFLYTKEAMPNYVMLLFIRREAIKNKIYFDKDLRMLEDVYYYQNLLHNIDSIYFYNKHLYHYNNCNISTTRDPAKAVRNIKGILDCNNKIRELLENHGTKYSVEKMNSCHINLVITYLNKAIYKTNYKKSKLIIMEVLNNSTFNRLINNCDINEFTKFRKKLFKFIINRKYLKVYMMLKSRYIIKKIWG